MKHLRPITRQLLQILAVSVVTGILILGVNAAFEDSTREFPDSPVVTSGDRALPDAVTEAVLQDASRRLSLPIEELRVVGAEARSWSDGCLGLAEPDTACIQMVVPGWRVTVENGRRRLIYRTDSSGSQVRLESSDLLDLAGRKTRSRLLILSSNHGKIFN